MTRTLFTFLHNKDIFVAGMRGATTLSRKREELWACESSKLIVIAPWCGGSFDLLELPCEAEGELRDMLV
jgi:hypothetical protein